MAIAGVDVGRSCSADVRCGKVKFAVNSEDGEGKGEFD